MVCGLPEVHANSCSVHCPCFRLLVKCNLQWFIFSSDLSGQSVRWSHLHNLEMQCNPNKIKTNNVFRHQSDKVVCKLLDINNSYHQNIGNDVDYLLYKWWNIQTHPIHLNNSVFHCKPYPRLHILAYYYGLFFKKTY